MRSDTALCSLHLSSDNVQSNLRDQVEQENTDLEHRHPSVVQGIKLLTGQMKPSAVQPIEPIVRQQEDQKPPYQYAIIDDCTPQQRLTCHRNAHAPSPAYLPPLCSLPV